VPSIRRRVLGDIEMHQPAPTVAQHHEHKQDSKGRGSYREEIQRDQIRGVVLQECSPRLRRRPPRSDHVFRHRRLRDSQAELQQLAVDLFVVLTRYHNATLADVISRAEKKLRQADFFVGHLVTQRAQDRLSEFMEFYLSAALTAAQSAFYVLRDGTGRAFDRQHKKWRQTRTQKERAFLNRMIRLRDDDVHRGTLDATTFDKFVDARMFSAVHRFDYSGDALVQETNPDGTTVRAPGLTMLPALYIEHAGQRIEATTACQHFIALLSDLVEYIKRVTTRSPETTT
jgi:hypothetical protein